MEDMEDMDLPAAAAPAASTQAFGRLRLIVDPRAGRRVQADVLPRLRAALEELGVVHDVVTSTGAGAVERSARSALEEGVRYLAAVGDDRTIHEVLGGMFDGARPLAPEAVLGVVGVGTGSDFARNFGLDRPAEVVARHLSTVNEMAIDVGTADCIDAAGRRTQRVFGNVAQVGYGAECVRRAARMPRALGRVRDLLAAYGAILSLQRQETRVVVDHTAAVLPVVNLVIANCQFTGGGMKVAPRALADDGRFNVQVFTGERSQVFLMTQKIYRGEHLPHPDITEWQSATVSITPPEPLPVEADGQLLGVTPATFGLLPQSLRLKI